MQLKRNGNGHNGNGRNGNGRNGVVKIVVLVLALVLVAVLAWRLFDRWRGPTAEVWVAATDLAPGSLVGTDDLERNRRRVRSLPAGALVNHAAIAGRLLGRTKQAGEPFVGGDFRRVSDGEPQSPQALSRVLPAGRVLMQVLVPLEDVVTRELRRGDRLDLLATPPRGGQSRLVAGDVYMLGWVDPNMRLQQQEPQEREGGGSEAEEEEEPGLIERLMESSLPPPGARRGSARTRSTKLLLALNPEDVVPLAEAQAAGAALTAVLHGRQEIEDGQLLVVQGRTWDIEYITGAERGNVEFVQ